VGLVFVCEEEIKVIHPMHNGLFCQRSKTLKECKIIRVEYVRKVKDEFNRQILRYDL
jgi:hypothetical protein